MKNKKVLIIATILIVVILLITITLLSINSIFQKEEIDYSEYSYFTNTRWTRETDSDIEYITFNSDGSFSYYCACGSPVDDSDLCDEYRYDEKTKTIKLKCIFKTSSTITKIKIKDYDENSIELNFNGEIRKFIKESAE